MGEIVSWPNFITLSRILITPLAVFAVLAGDKVFFQIGSWGISGYLCACLCALYAGLSDFLDGYIARKTNRQSMLGNLFDPVADKIFLLWVMYALAVPVWLLLAIVTRDMWIMMLRGFAVCTHATFKTSILAKTKTAILFVFVLVELLSRTLLSGMTVWETFYFTEITIVFIVLSALHYTYVFGGAYLKRKKTRS